MRDFTGKPATAQGGRGAAFLRRLRADWIPAYAGMTAMGNVGDGARRVPSAVLSPAGFAGDLSPYRERWIWALRARMGARFLRRNDGYGRKARFCYTGERGLPQGRRAQ